MQISSKNLAAFIDQTLLKPDTTVGQIRTLCHEAREYQFAVVCVHPIYIALVHDLLKGSFTRAATVVGFPSGAHRSEVKKMEATLALNDGAGELDMVINIGALKSGDYDYVLQEIQAIREICSTHDAICKVIIETALLTETEKIKACELVISARPAFIKTSTGFAAQGATEADVHLLHQLVSPHGIGVKAAGGIRDYATAAKMIAAGAARIGTSSGVKIIQEARQIEKHKG